MSMVNRKSILIACCSVLLLSVLALSLNLRFGGQLAQGSAHKVDEDLIRQIEASPDQTLKVAGNEGCPLQLVEARVKEIPASLFTRLTG